MWTFFLALALARAVNVKTFEPAYQPTTLECRGTLIKSDGEMVIGARRLDWLDATLRSAPPEANVPDIHLAQRKRAGGRIAVGSVLATTGVAMAGLSVPMGVPPFALGGLGLAVVGLTIDLAALPNMPPGRQVKRACEAYTLWRATARS